MDDVSKLVGEAQRQLRLLHLYVSPSENLDLYRAMNTVCDALESVAKENAESEKRADLWKHNAEVWKANHDSALVELADMRKERNTLRDGLAAVAKERDAAVEALKEIAGPSVRSCSHIFIARAALEKLNAK